MAGIWVGLVCVNTWLLLPGWDCWISGKCDFVYGLESCLRHAWSWCVHSDPDLVCTIHVQVEHKQWYSPCSHPQCQCVGECTQWLLPEPPVLERVHSVTLPFVKWFSLENKFISLVEWCGCPLNCGNFSVSWGRWIWVPVLQWYLSSCTGGEAPSVTMSVSSATLYVVFWPLVQKIVIQALFLP